MRRQERKERLAKLLAEGKTLREIADEFGISRQGVHNMIRRAEDQSGDERPTLMDLDQEKRQEAIRLASSTDTPWSVIAALIGWEGSTNNLASGVRGWCRSQGLEVCSRRRVRAEKK